MKYWSLFFLFVSLPVFAQRQVEWVGEPVKIAPQGCYARVARLGQSRWMAAFEDTRGNVVVSTTSDGHSWSVATVAISGYEVIPDSLSFPVRVNAANAELCRLSDGTLLCAANYRPSAGGVVPFSIAIARSADDGATWSEPHILYEAGSIYRDGCWEPSFLELQDGTVHIYFADEGPYPYSPEQQISYMCSSDGGLTWTAPAMASFRPRRRDGMPVPAVFGDEIVVAIEDNADGNFKPYTVRTHLPAAPDQAAPWSTPVIGDSPLRDYALAEPLPSEVYAGAPYLMSLPDGTALLSYQIAENGALGSACMEVVAGDCFARAFTARSRPFGNTPGLWNSLALWDFDGTSPGGKGKVTIVAVTTASLDGLAQAPWLRFGIIR